MATRLRKPSSGGGVRKNSKFDKQSRRESMFVQEVSREGYLDKQSSGLVKQWQRRYFEQVRGVRKGSLCVDVRKACVLPL